MRAISGPFQDALPRQRTRKFYIKNQLALKWLKKNPPRRLLNKKVALPCARGWLLVRIRHLTSASRTHGNEQKGAVFGLVQVSN
jgi:hypothetical protein